MVTSFSITGRRSLAFASVVVIRSCMIMEMASWRKSAWRWAGLRPSFRPAFRCRTVLLLVVQIATDAALLERAQCSSHIVDILVLGFRLDRAADLRIFRPVAVF